MNTCGGPVNKSIVADSSQNFFWLYGALNNNIQNLNLSCQPADFITQTGLNVGWQNDDQGGIVLTFMIDESNPMAPFYSVACVLGTQDANGNVTPMPGSPYFSLKQNGAIEVYDTPQKIQMLQGWIQNFGNVNLQAMFQINTPASTSVNALPNHPRFTFLSKNAWYAFFENNGMTLPVAGSLLNLSFHALYCPITNGLPQNEYKSITPVLTFSQNGVSMVNNYFNDLTKAYTMKGLGMGPHFPPGS